MAFYKNNSEMAAHLKKLIETFEVEGRPGLKKNISITWIRYDEFKPNAGSGEGTGWLNNNLIYPASIVKIVYAVAIEAWIQKNLIIETNEIKRALFEMIRNSSNNATSYILDILSATTSGPSLNGAEWEKWKKQRLLINQWLRTLNREEFAGINCCQKTWDESPYGREKDFYGINNINRNALSSDSTAWFLEAIMTDNIISPLATKKLKKLLCRSLDIIERKSNPENQIDGFIGEGIATDKTNLWSKAGLTSEVRHDAAWWHSHNQKPMLLVIFSKNKLLSNDTFLLPTLAGKLNNFRKEI